MLACSLNEIVNLKFIGLLPNMDFISCYLTLYFFVSYTVRNTLGRLGRLEEFCSLSLSSPDLTHSSPSFPGMESKCVCGRSFAQPGALKKHQHSCNKTKNRLAGALAKAKELWTTRKRRRIDDSDSACQGSSQLEPQDKGMVTNGGITSDVSIEVDPEAYVPTEIQVELHSSL